MEANTMSFNDIPEQSLDPPEKPYVMADCQHEVYDGESMVEWAGHTKIETLCADCFFERIRERSVEEIASALNFRCETVRF
jgi:hypothetical protein